MEKLVINLNVPEREADEMVNNPYTCLTCNKSFSNGKAFGGHKRVHLLKKKEKKPNEVVNPEFYEDKPRYYTCSICPKTLRSESSFKKHQITHLQGEQPKGTVEPSNTATCTSTLSATTTDGIPVKDDPVNLENGEEHKFSDMSKFLPPSWSKTGKRTLIAGGQISTPEDVRQVAKNLIVLSQGSVRAEDLPPKKRMIEFPPFEEMAPYQHEETVLDDKREGKGLAFVATSPGDVKEAISGDYTCHQCNRSFATYQALGGHRSHHKKAVNPESSVRIPKSDVKTESRVRFPKSNGSSSSSPVAFKCSFCNKSFKMRHAFAGHRTHCKAPVPLAQVAVEENIDEAIVQVPKGAHLFDLNEVPPPEDGDGMDDNNMATPTLHEGE